MIKNICCIGAGYVGGPTMAVTAKNCPDLMINVVDISSERIKAWNSTDLSKLPVFEPGLKEIIKECRGKNLFFSTEVENNITKADIIFISVNTPTKKFGLGKGYTSDLTWIEASARKIAEFSQNHTIIVEKSTLPVRTAEVIKKILEASESCKGRNNLEPVTFDVLSNPEFLAEGTAIKDLEFPDRVLIGGENKKAIDTLSAIYRKWVPSNKILHSNIWSSELAKLTANAFLAQRISSINSISALCENTGADIREVSRAIGLDSRIGAKFLNCGPGFGGSCFKKDILNLVYLSRYFNLNEVADFWESVVTLNKWHQHRISNLVTKKLFGTLANKKILILGFAFKSNTNDTRESAAIQICKDLLEEGADLYIHDPKVSSHQIEIDLGIKQKIPYYENEINSKDISEGNWISVNNHLEAFHNVDAVIILTEWEEYYEINWNTIIKTLRKPAWIFDTRSVIDLKEIKATKGVNIWQIGMG